MINAYKVMVGKSGGNNPLKIVLHRFPQPL
jgi:hypothetical protein